MTKNKKQHYIPEFYLKAWYDPNPPDSYGPYIWVASKDGSSLKRKVPSLVFHENNLYTIKENNLRNLNIETGLAKIEDRFAKLRDSKLKTHTDLSQSDRAIISTFAAAMHSRTLASAERWQPFWQELAGKAKMMTDWAASATPEQLKSPSLAPAIRADANFQMTYNEIQDYGVSPLKHLVPAGLDVMPPMLMQMDLAILETTTKPGFITSDDPCVMGESFSRKRSYLAGLSLMSPTIEILLPISPSQCLFFNRQGKNGYVYLSQYGPLVDSEIVIDTNRRIWINTREFFVINTPKLLIRWFVSQ